MTSQRTCKGVLFTLLTIVLVTLMLSIVITYVLLDINYSNQAAQSYGIASLSQLSSTMQTGMGTVLTASLQQALAAYPGANAVVAYPLNTTAASVLGARVASDVLANPETASFNGVGTGSSIDAGSGASLNMGSGDLTVEAWIRTSSNSIIRTIVYKRIASPAAGYFLAVSTTHQPEFGIDVGGTHYYLIGSNAIVDDNNWHQVVGIRKSGTSYIYVDGVLNSNTMSSAGDIDSTSDLYLGTWWGVTTHNFNGSMANVQVYNSALTSNQVQQLYSKGITGAPVSSNVVGWWPLNGNANDYSGQGNSGAATNVVYSSSSNTIGSLNNYAAALIRQAHARNANITITNQSVTVFQTSMLWINATYTAMAKVNSTFGSFTLPLSSSVSVPRFPWRT